MKPKRIQLRRTKGWRMPPNTVKVTRPGPFGNPFQVGTFVEFEATRYSSGGYWIGTNAQAVALFEALLALDHTLREAVKKTLRGKHLACWCRLDQICHADPLLRIANE